MASDALALATCLKPRGPTSVYEAPSSFHIPLPSRSPNNRDRSRYDAILLFYCRSFQTATRDESATWWLPSWLRLITIAEVLGEDVGRPCWDEDTVDMDPRDGDERVQEGEAEAGVYKGGEGFAAPLLDHHYKCWQPTGRPLIEPPIFDYDDFIENQLPSDRRFAKLFPDDISKWVICRDVYTEHMLLLIHLGWCIDLKIRDADQTRSKFYEGLQQALLEEWKTVDREQQIAWRGASVLGQWEFEQLDQDGDTKKIQGMSAYDWDRSRLSKEAWEKYGHLAPLTYKPSRFYDTYTQLYTDLDGNYLDPRLSGIRQELPDQSRRRLQGHSGRESETSSPIQPESIVTVEQKQWAPAPSSGSQEATTTATKYEPPRKPEDHSPSPTARQLFNTKSRNNDQQEPSAATSEDQPLDFSLHPWFNAF